MKLAVSFRCRPLGTPCSEAVSQYRVFSSLGCSTSSSRQPFTCSRQSTLHHRSTHLALACSSRAQNTLLEHLTDTDWRSPLGPRLGLPPGAPVGVALGKFDAMHKGHRALAAAAADAGYQPCLLSFDGMAQVLGWPVSVPFSAVRQLSPEDFVRVLAQDMKVAAAVVGENYRFGYRAAGTAGMLETLGEKYGMRVLVLDLIGADAPGIVGQVASSRVRDALEKGDLRRVRLLLGRPYRLVAPLYGAAVDSSRPGSTAIPQEALENQAPGFTHGGTTYVAALSFATGDGQPLGGALPEVPVLVTREAISIKLSADELSRAAQTSSPATEVLINMDFTNSARFTKEQGSW